MFRNAPEREFPAWASSECYGALHSAKAKIDAVGKHRIKDHDLRVEFIKGEQMFAGRWAWKDAETGMWVLGLNTQWGRLVQVAIDPARMTDPNAIDLGTLEHEIAHHWLVSSGYNSFFHYREYDSLFYNWEHARNVTGKSKITKVLGVAELDGTHYDYAME